MIYRKLAKLLIATTLLAACAGEKSATTAPPEHEAETEAESPFELLFGDPLERFRESH